MSGQREATEGLRASRCGRRSVHAAHEMVWDSGYVTWCPGKKTLREEVELLRTERDWWDNEGRKMNRRIIELENRIQAALTVCDDLDSGRDRCDSAAGCPTRVRAALLGES